MLTHRCTFFITCKASTMSRLCPYFLWKWFKITCVTQKDIMWKGTCQPDKKMWLRATKNFNLVKYSRQFLIKTSKGLGNKLEACKVWTVECSWKLTAQKKGGKQVESFYSALPWECHSYPFLTQNFLLGWMIRIRQGRCNKGGQGGAAVRLVSVHTQACVRLSLSSRMFFIFKQAPKHWHP